MSESSSTITLWRVETTTHFHFTDDHVSTETTGWGVFRKTVTTRTPYTRTSKVVDVRHFDNYDDAHDFIRNTQRSTRAAYVRHDIKSLLAILIEKDTP